MPLGVDAQPLTRFCESFAQAQTAARGVKGYVQLWRGSLHTQSTSRRSRADTQVSHISIYRCSLESRSSSYATNTIAGPLSSCQQRHWHSTSREMRQVYHVLCALFMVSFHTLGCINLMSAARLSTILESRAVFQSGRIRQAGDQR
jgi:hypothetical protein